MDPDTHAKFGTTHWSVVDALRGCGSDAQRGGLFGRLIEQYSSPIYAWFRGSGMSPQDAHDSTQAFITDVLLSRNLFSRADRGRGRLRTLLRAALRRYHVDLHRRRQARPEAQSVCVDEIDVEAAGADNPAQAFERGWALAVLEESLSRTERQFQLSGRTDYWRAFEARVLRPCVSGADARSPEALAADLGFRDAAHVAVAVHTVKSRVTATFRQVVAETVENPADREDEYQRLTARLSRHG